jgi:glycerophosphoryl diester phosphodiesterase
MIYRRLIQLFVVAATSPAFAQPHFDFFAPVQPGREVQITAHRSMHVVAPENTTAALQACADDFIEWCETDVRRTKDGVHVIMHDSTLDRTTDGSGAVKDHTLAELRGLSAGSQVAPRFASLRITTLPEFLGAAKGRVNIDLDCKDIDVSQLVREILDAGMEHQVVAYGGTDLVASVLRKGNGKVAAMTKFRPASMQFDAFVRDVAPAAVEIDADVVTPEWCTKFHAAGIQVQIKVLGEWDTPKIWNRVLACKPDRLQSDDTAGLRFEQLNAMLHAAKVKIAMHRGANRYAPENTLASLREGARLGAGFLEFDIRTGADGSFFLMHDRGLARTCGIDKPAAATTRADLAGVSPGTWFSTEFKDEKVPSLDEAMDALGSTAWGYLDAKAIHAAELIKAIDRHNLRERHVVYGSAEYARQLRAIDPNIRTLIPLGTVEELDGALAERPYGVDTEWTIVTQPLVDRCHAAGVKVFSDAMGENETVESYRKAIRSGIDVIQTDHPLRVWRALELEAAAKSR